MKHNYCPLQVLVILFLSVVILASCGKRENPVPLTEVNFTIQNIEYDPQYGILRMVGQSVFMRNSAQCWGYNCNGIIVYRYKADYDWDDFRVFDATCPHCLGAQAFVIDAAFPDMASCPRCGSIFTMHGDYMLQGPARHPLRLIRSSFINGDLHID
ncbi:MAG: hypothetical protein LBU90_07035 [Bacteroidales bacterium]|jgi:Rieske Fe-S protein|nr:hypothetical protein [Bacteroidales bacterium]